MDLHNNPFAILDGDEEGDVAVLIEKIEADQANPSPPPPEPEKLKPLADKSVSGIGEGSRGRGNGKSVFGPYRGDENSFPRAYGGDSNGRGRVGGRGGRGQGFYENRRVGSNENNVSNGKGLKEGGESQQGVNLNERRRQYGFGSNENYVGNGKGLKEGGEIQQGVNLNERRRQYGFGSNENYVGNGKGLKEGGEIQQSVNFNGRRQYGGENREFGWEERRYGGRGRGGYGGFRGGEVRRFNGGRYGGRNDRDVGPNRQGSQNPGNVDGKEENANGDNAGAKGEMPETTEVAKDAEVCKQSADQVISEDLSQKNGASKNKEQEQEKKEEKEKREKYEKRRKESEEDAKQMTLAQYSKVLEEKRRALEANKVEERKVVDGEEFKGMQLVERKKDKKEEIFIKLVSKEKLRKGGLDKEEKLRKSLSIDEFLNPSVGQRYRLGRRSSPDGEDTKVEVHSARPVQQDPVKIEDPTHFPQLGKVAKVEAVKA